MVWQPHMKIVTDSRHAYFLKEAYRQALNSDDLTTKVGAALVQQEDAGYRMMGGGTNVLLRFDEADAYGAEDNQLLGRMLLDRSWKYAHMMHAEHTVIERLTKMDIETMGMIMYMPWVPCEPCARRMDLAKLSTLVTHESMVLKTPERWWESTNKALDFLQDKGIECLMYRGEIGGISSTFDGLVWQP